MPDYAVYKLTIAVLTPLHIGSGRDLLNEYDYTIHKGQTWRLNDAALLDAQDADDPGIADRLAQTPPAQLLEEKDFTPTSPFFRYVIPGAPHSQQEGAPVLEQIKDIYDRPYLPGSSLKGALRTVLAWHGWKEMNLKPDISKLGERAKFAAQNYEREIFVAEDARRGHEPNYDVLRALQISDSQPLDAACLRLVNASVLNRSGQTGSKEIPIKLEAIRTNTTFESTLKLDLALFSSWAQSNGLRLKGEAWLRQLPQVCRAYAARRMAQEVAWFQNIPGKSGQRLLTTYQQIGQTPLEGNQFVLQLGWGTGWDSKTFGSHLSNDTNFMEAVIANRDYHMSRGKRRSGDPFPKSRRVIISRTEMPDGRHNDIPGAPLGWLLLTLEPIGGTRQDWVELTRPAAPLLSTPPEAPKTVAPASQPAIAPRQETNHHPEVHIPPAARPVEREAPTAQAFTDHFNTLPKPGDHFYGTIFDCRPDGELWLEIPGLDADEKAAAVIRSAENPGKRRYKDGARLACEVIRLAADPQQKGYTLVYCRLV